MLESVHLFYLALLGLALLFSAFFACSEAALLSAQPLRVQQLAEKGVRGAKRLARLVERPERFLPTVLVGNNLVNTGAATLGTLIAVSAFGEGAGAVIATVAIAVLLIIFGDSIPKAVGARFAERVALAAVGPVLVLERAMWPLVAPAQQINRFVISLLGGPRQRGLMSQEEFKFFIALSLKSGAVDKSEAELFHRMLRVTERRIQEVMTPRNAIVGIPLGMTLAQFLEFNARQYQSRFPVYEGNLDNIVGTLLARDVTQALGRNQLQPGEAVTRLMRPAHFAPETMPIVDALRQMREQGMPLALVVDEYGTVAGLVTYRQLMEEIVGRVREDGEAADYRSVDAHSYEARGSLRVDTFNEQTGLCLPEGDYETLAGLVIHLAGRLPEPGDQFTLDGYSLTVLAMQGPRLEKVRVTRVAVPASPVGGV